MVGEAGAVVEALEELEEEGAFHDKSVIYTTRSPIWFIFGEKLTFMIENPNLKFFLRADHYQPIYGRSNFGDFTITNQF